MFAADAYLAHISPRDRMYGGSETNIVGQILKKMQGFDIYPSEKHSVSFAIIAPHLETMTELIDGILEKGFFLSQISLFYRPNAETAALVYDYRANELIVTWKMDDAGKQVITEKIDGEINIGEIVKQIIFPSK